MGFVQHGEETDRTVLLVPLPEHLSFLHRLALDADVRWPWLDSARSFGEFQGSLQASVYEHYVITDKMNNAPIGYLSLQDMNFFHGYVWISLFLDQTTRRAAFPFEAVALVIQRVFAHSAIRHIYAELTEDSARALGAARLGATLVEFPDKLRVNGDVCDQLVLSISRSQWDEISTRLLAT